MENSVHVTKTGLANIADNFHPVVIQKDGGFCVYLPEWRISGVGVTLVEAWAEYETRFAEAVKRVNEFGLATMTLEPFPLIGKREMLRELGLFFAKVVVSVFVVIALVILLLPNIAAAVRHNLTGMLPKEMISAKYKDPEYWAVQFPEKINARLDRLQPEQEEQMRREWARLIGRTSPIIFSTNCPVPKQSAPQR